MRCQSRLLRSENDGRNPQSQDAADDLFDLLNLLEGVGDTANVDIQFANPSTISDLRTMMEQLTGNTDARAGDEDASIGDADPGAENMEEDDEWENHDYSSDEEYESDFDEAYSDEEQNEGDFMEDDDLLMETSHRADDQPRSISVSSDDI